MTDPSELVEVEVEQSFRVTYVIPDGYAGEVPSIADSGEKVMNVLVEMSDAGDLLDSAVSVDTQTERVTIEVTLMADGIEDGIGRGMAAMRAAIHKVGDLTPGWPSHREVLEMVGQAVRAEVVTPDTADAR